MIKTRVDRADPQWLQTLDYSPNIKVEDDKNQKITTIDFNQTTNRNENFVHSKYPIRQSLKPYIPNNQVNWVHISHYSTNDVNNNYLPSYSTYNRHGLYFKNAGIV